MKKTISYLLILLSLAFNNSIVWADAHSSELREIGEKIKQAVKAGKISEKEGWSKWSAVLREYEKNEEEEEDWDEVEELEHQIEIRELEFELERMEREHSLEHREWEQRFERMEQDFERERREWHMEQMNWEKQKRQIEEHTHRQNSHGMHSKHSSQGRGERGFHDRGSDHSINHPSSSKKKGMEKKNKK